MCFFFLTPSMLTFLFICCSNFSNHLAFSILSKKHLNCFGFTLQKHWFKPQCVDIEVYFGGWVWIFVFSLAGVNHFSSTTTSFSHFWLRKCERSAAFGDFCDTFPKLFRVFAPKCIFAVKHTFSLQADRPKSSKPSDAAGEEKSPEDTVVMLFWIIKLDDLRLRSSPESKTSEFSSC